MATNEILSFPSTSTAESTTAESAISNVSTKAACSAIVKAKIAKPKSKPKIVVSDKHKTMSNWTLKELKLLRTEIRSGKTTVKDIQLKILSKTEEEVDEAISYCVNKATELSSREYPPLVKRKRKLFLETIPQWLDLMAKDNDIYELISVIYSDALKDMIKNVLPANKCDGVDFIKIHTYLVKALKGELVPKLDGVTHYVYNMALRESILGAKYHLANNEKLVNHFKSLLTCIPSEIPDDGNVSISEELKNLVFKAEYNPFKIPLHYLNVIPSSESSSSDEDD